MRFRLGLILARAVRALTRLAGRSGGTTLPGRVLLRVDPHALARFRPRLAGNTMLVSATNGKTTTAAMVASVLERSGRSVVHNRAGSNMHWGVATALMDASKEGDDTALLEVDEAWLPQVADALRPSALLLGNLFRDQLDRYGELETLADAWAQLAGAQPDTTLILNADDPLVADLGRERERVTYFGIDDRSQGSEGMQHASDSKHCRRCGSPYVYETVYLAHLGLYRCPNCGRERPTPEVAAERIALRGMSGSEVHVRTPRGSLHLELSLPGLYNVYNALAAVAGALELGASLDAVKRGLEGTAAVFGRTERLRIGSREVAILLVKNPTGANEVLRTLALEQGSFDIWLALNDRIADGRDISWVWDADFELLAGRLAHVTCSGTRAEEMALRLKYAGVEAPIRVERDLGRSLDLAVNEGDGGPLYALPTYTALLELRDLLASRGLAKRWSE